MAARTPPQRPPVIVIFGDEEYQKSASLHERIGACLPPEVDRTMAYTEYDGGRPETQGGPALASVLDDLCTLPFLSDRRVVLLRDADEFVSRHREPLERYLQKPAAAATLILVLRSFPKTTRLYKLAHSIGDLVECKKLNARGLVDFAVRTASESGKTFEPAVAAELVERVGGDQGLIAGEVEKLILHSGTRTRITRDDVLALSGLSREERVFAVADLAAQGRIAEAIGAWRQLLATDSAAEYRAVGGLAFVLRRWLAAHASIADGSSVREIAPRMMMWGRERELEQILRRMRPERVRRAVARLARLDAQVKVGARSIENGVEALLCDWSGAL